MRINNFVFGIIVTVLVFCGLPSTSAHADTWDVGGEAVQGLTSNGDSYSRVKTYMENPDGELLFGLAPTDSWFELTFINDEIETFNQARIFYDLGQSDNFKLSALYLNKPFECTGVGITYNPAHWGDNLDWLYHIDLSAWIVENGEYAVAFDGNYEFALGYGVEAHVLSKTEWMGKDNKQINTLGRVTFWHNLEPDHSLFIEAGYEFYQYNDDGGYLYFGVGGSI